MRFVTIETPHGPRAAGLRAQEVVDLHSVDPGLPASLKSILSGGSELMRRARHAIEKGPGQPLESVRLLPPIPDPQKVICVGLNYVDHAKETGAKIPTEPVIFNKFPTSLVPPDGDIVLPRVSAQVDYEAELVAIIGAAGRNIPRQRALEYVAGYCCGHDVSARDWQKGKPGGQWLLGKSFDAFAPLGPCLVTPDEVSDPGNLQITLRLNGEVRQSSNTNQLIFPVDFLIAYLSSVFTLLPGDLLFTGTPSGVGMARNPPAFMQAGDRVEVEIEKLGRLSNRVVAET